MTPLYYPKGREYYTGYNEGEIKGTAAERAQIVAFLDDHVLFAHITEESEIPWHHVVTVAHRLRLAIERGDHAKPGGEP